MTIFNERLRTFYFELYGEVADEKGDALNIFIKDLATELGLRGWCNKTLEGSVEGYAEGPITILDKFKNYFLPLDCQVAKIDHAVFGFEEPIDEYSVDEFMIQDDEMPPHVNKITTDYTPIFDDPI